MLGLVARVAAGVLVTSAAALATPVAPASAATCGGATGVSVVVDFHDLGGGVVSACDGAGGGQDAATLFTSNGFALTYVQRQPGFVCRVDGAPATDPCVNTPPADAYWSVWWSDGTSSTWKYASVGVGSLTVPAGGSVALSWQGGAGQAPPGVKPPVHAAPTGPTQSPTHGPTSSPSASTSLTHAPTSHPPSTPGAPVTTSPAGVTSATPTATASSVPVATPLHPGASPTTGPSQGHAVATSPVGPPSGSPQAGSATETSATSGDGRLPSWVAPVLIVLLFLAAGVVAVVRRGRTGRHR